MRSLLVALLVAVPLFAHAEPNVFVIYLDDMGQEMFAPNSIGSPAITYTTNLDEFASEGIRFTQVGVQTVCTPSRYSALTGNQPIRAKIGRVSNVLATKNTQGMPADAPNMISTFRQAGYETACIGKWHLMGIEDYQGDNSASHPLMAGCNRFRGHYQNVLTSLYTYIETPGYWDWEVAEGDRDATSGKLTTRTQRTREYQSEYATDRALEFLNEQDGTTPWFVWYAPQMLHAPFHDASVGTRSGTAGALSGTEAACSDDQPSGTPQLDCYYTMLAHLDYELGLIKTKLEAMQAVGQEIHVYIVPDNGTPPSVVRASAFGGANQKGSMNIGATIVTMYVWGDQVPGGNVGDVGTDPFIASTDLPQTVASLAGLDFRGLDSIDASGCVTGDPTSISCTSRQYHSWTKFDPSDGTMPDDDEYLDPVQDYNNMGGIDNLQLGLELLGYLGYTGQVREWVTDPVKVDDIRNGDENEVTSDIVVIGYSDSYQAQGAMTAGQYSQYKNLRDYIMCLRENDGVGDRDDICHERTDAW